MSSTSSRYDDADDKGSESGNSSSADKQAPTKKRKTKVTKTRGGPIFISTK